MRTVNLEYFNISVQTAHPTDTKTSLSRDRPVRITHCIFDRPDIFLRTIALSVSDAAW
jgi:hypothetical protein